MDWIKVGVDMLVDPERDKRIAQQVHSLHEELGRQREAFSLQSVSASLRIPTADLPAVTETVFSNILKKAWEDSQVTDQERRLLEWAANKLQLSPERQKQLRIEAGFNCYQRVLATAMQDGRITQQERHILDQIALAMGSSVPELTFRFFREQCEGFLRGVFAAIVNDERIVQEEWTKLLETVKNLGMSQQQFLTALEPQAQAFIEHVFADAKSDGLLSDEERATLEWLLTQFQLSPRFQAYALEEIRELQLFTEIAYGRLPSLGATAVELRSGEIAHFEGPALYELIKNSRGNAKLERHEGSAVITDERLIFTSALKSHALNLRNIVQACWTQSGVEVRSTSKGAGLYKFGPQNRLAYGILRCAVGRANQTITEQQDGEISRHISRSVRQRVWQKYGGRCVECQSDQYLEYDHIIPVAKGGSNSENNVQLLCRGCNLKKSDYI